MLYFRFSYDYELKTIGAYPQTKLMKGYNPLLENSYWNINQNELANFEVDFKLEITKGAFPTSFLDGVGGAPGIIVNEKLKDFLLKFNLPPHKFYKTDVSYKSSILNYYCLHFITENIWEHINFKKSTLKIVSAANPKNFVIQPIIDKSYLFQLYSYYFNDFNYELRPNVIHFNDSFPEYDIFDIPNLINVPVFSSKLKKAIEQEGFNGGEFKLLRELKS